jgi:hypothetical protein
LDGVTQGQLLHVLLHLPCLQIDVGTNEVMAAAGICFAQILAFHQPALVTTISHCETHCIASCCQQHIQEFNTSKSAAGLRTKCKARQLDSRPS